MRLRAVEAPRYPTVIGITGWTQGRRLDRTPAAKTMGKIDKLSAAKAALAAETNSLIESSIFRDLDGVDHPARSARESFGHSRTLCRRGRSLPDPDGRGERQAYR